MRIRRMTAVVGAAALVATIAAPASAAVTDATDITIIGGALDFSVAPTVGNFSDVTLDGTAKSTAATIGNFEVTDARGLGLGWKVTVQASQFAEHNGTSYPAGGKTLATNSLAMTAPSVAQDGTTSAAPSVSSGPYSIDTGSTAVQIASAALTAGMGRYDFTPGSGSLTLSIPSSAYAKTYRSDVTFTVATGP